MVPQEIRTATLLRRLFVFGAAALALVTLGVWVASADERWRIGPGPMHPTPPWWHASVGRSEIYAQWWVNRPTQAQHDDRWWIQLYDGFGVGYTGSYEPPGHMRLSGIYYDVVVPLWIVTLAFATPPTLSLWRSLRDRRRRRAAQVPCARCAYDLTGNTSGRCPECGAAIATPRLSKPQSGGRE